MFLPLGEQFWNWKESNKKIFTMRKEETFFNSEANNERTFETTEWFLDRLELYAVAGITAAQVTLSSLSLLTCFTIAYVWEGKNRWIHCQTITSISY